MTCPRCGSGASSACTVSSSKGGFDATLQARQRLVDAHRRQAGLDAVQGPESRRARRPHDDCPERWTCYRTEACVGYNDALAAGAEVDVLDALWTEHEAAMEALRRLRPRTVDGLERSDDDE